MTKAIGDTASITLLTGLPGSGKSARLVKFILQAIAAGELVYTCNVDGIKVPGVLPWEDPTAWRDLPPGSVLVVDEAQQFFRARRSGDPPEYITAMEKIRHDGVRLILATQQPNYLDTHLRGLVGMHEHLVREDGGKSTFIFRSTGSIIDNVRITKKKAKELYDYETWVIDPETFTYYTSAQVHTMKYAMPAKLKKAAVLLPLAVAAFALPFVLIFRDGYTKATAGKESEAVPLAARASDARPPRRFGTSAGDEPRTAEELALLITPTIPGVAWSAPAWSGREVQSDPHIYCLAVGERDRYEGCRCFSEQGTRVQMELLECIDVARNGEPYNPFKPPEPRTSERYGGAGSGAGQRPADMAPTGAAPSSSTLAQGEPLAHYGWFRDER